MDTTFKERFMRSVQRIASLVVSERNADYGDPAEDFEAAIAIYAAITRAEVAVIVTPADHALYMACVKLAREGHAHKPDNLEDGAAYLLLRNALLDGE